MSLQPHGAFNKISRRIGSEGRKPNRVEPMQPTASPDGRFSSNFGSPGITTAPRSQCQSQVPK
jgi:hypothetical protein